MSPLLFLLAACEFGPQEASWHDQLVADGPCYRVDLLDGLSEEDTSELHDLFACLDQGNLGALAGLVDALDAPDRDGTPAGVEVARLVNHLPALGLDLAALLDGAVALLGGEQQPLIGLARVLVELLYGRPWDSIALAGPSTEASALQAGVLVPLLPLVSELATLALDRDDDLAGLAAGALRSERGLDAVATLLALAAAEEGLLLQVRDDLLPALGEGVALAQVASNDHGAGASGNSLRDVVVALVADDGQGSTPLELLLTPAAAMLGDAAAAEGLIEALDLAERGGHLDPLPAQVALLATEDVRGGSLEAGEDSALVALLRLLYLGHREVSCSTLGIEWLHEDDLSVWLLELLADQEPDSVDFLLEVGGWTLSYGELVEALAGQCTVDSTQFAADAPALERLVDPEVGDLLVVLLGLLQGLQPDGAPSRIPELVELVGLVHLHGLTGPVEELLKDLAPARIVQLLLDLVPTLLDPWSDRAWCADGTESCAEETWSGWDEASFAGGRHPLDILDLFALPGLLLAPDEEGRSPADRARAAAQRVARSGATWDALAHLGALLVSPGAQTAGLIARLPEWAAVDPERKFLSTAADLLEDGACIAPALKVAETPEIQGQLAASSPEREGPLPFLARLVVDDTLAELLDTIHLVLDFLLEARP